MLGTPGASRRARRGSRVGGHGLPSEIALDIRVSYAHALYEEPRASQDDLIEALAIIEDVETRQRRIYGDSHPFTRNTQELLEGARTRLEDVDAGSL